MSGEGKGVTSPIAAMTGLGITLLVPLADPMLFVKAVLRLGVLDIGRKLPVEDL